MMPTTKHRIAVNLDEDEFAELDAMADKHDVSLAWLGRQAVLEFLTRYRNEQLRLPLRLDAR
jgi:predicted transcriptional regulator